MTTPPDSSSLVEVADGVWTVPAPLRFFGVQINTRMSVCKLADGGIVLIGPVSHSEALAASVDAVGPVRAIIAPNLLHHLYVGEWMAAYSGARSFAAKGVAAKRPELSFSATLGPAYDEVFGAEVERFPIDGMPRLNESLFVHHGSRTLIATDFCFYMPEAKGFAAVFAALMGVRKKVRVEPIFKAWIKDKTAFRASLLPLRALQIDHLSMCHHEVISGDATATLQAVLDQVKVPPRGS
jgi:hypothetical protein